MDGALRTDWESCIQQAWIKELFLCCCDKPRPPLWPRERLRFSSYSSRHRNTLVNYSQNKWVQGQISIGWSLVSFFVCIERELWDLGGCEKEKEQDLDFPGIQCWWSEHFLQVHTSSFIQQWCWICRNVTTCSVNLCDMDTKTFFLLHCLHWMRARSNLWLEQCRTIHNEPVLLMNQWKRCWNSPNESLTISDSGSYPFN